ncbi:MAG: hypothetical protein COB20_03570 [SAR86 cluster bacterium]|uniref:DUF560 domain-containing protein n=1 Tax=SAR86 cluster bacterium TaxID=2030880 RepID=A0A2A4XBP2_9GAMM|nr:MAG: hypothetical protein COB20_03570 [SAR86 cluster bacterium]
MQPLFSVRSPKLVLVLCTAVISFPSSLAHANTFSQLGVNAGHESNVPRGQDGPHKEESSFLTVSYSIGKLYELGLKNTLILSGEINATRFNELRGFDKRGINVAANYNYKWALGAYAPVVSLSTSYALEEYEGRARDNELLTVDVSYLRRLSPAWFLTLGADYQDSSSDSLPHDPIIEMFGYDPDRSLPFELYDYDSTSVYADIEYAFENGMLLNAGYRRVDGVTVSSTTWPTQALYNVADALYSDPAFKANWIAYQLKADTNEWTLGLSIPSSQDSSINFGYSFYDISAVGGSSYVNRIFSVSYVQSF